VSSSTIGALASEEIEQASLDPPRSEIPRGTTVLALPTGAPWTDLNPKPDLRSTTGIPQLRRPRPRSATSAIVDSGRPECAKLAGALDDAGSNRAGDETVVTDAAEAARQDVQGKAADERRASAARKQRSLSDSAEKMVAVRGPYRSCCGTIVRHAISAGLSGGRRQASQTSGWCGSRQQIETGCAGAL
jgi:hypothetical protein